MKPSRSKRRRLMQSYITITPRHDLPAIFESLNDDTLTTVLEFLGGKSYRSFGGLNKHCKEIYLATPGITKESYIYGYAPLSVIQDRIERADDWELYESVGKGVVFYNRRDVLYWALQQQKKYVMRGICNIAAGEGRIDILDEVCNNMNYEDAKRYIFYHVDTYAANFGKLNVLKWLESKGLSIKFGCAMNAAHYGYLHIIQWLREEKDLELDDELYDHATKGGQLHVLKWLREKGVNWGERTFEDAARKGNLDVLQWLHDEGCPWPEGDYLIPYRVLKAEVIDWCRSNGYGARLFDW